MLTTENVVTLIRHHQIRDYFKLEDIVVPFTNKEEFYDMVQRDHIVYDRFIAAAKSNAVFGKHRYTGVNLWDEQSPEDVEDVICMMVDEMVCTEAKILVNGDDFATVAPKDYDLSSVLKPLSLIKFQDAYYEDDIAVVELSATIH